MRFGGGSWLFTHLSTSISGGETIGLTGPSGSGKSTLLSLLARESTPTEGSVTRSGIGRIGWVFQNPYGVKGRTALDHVTLPIIARGALRPSAEQQAHQILGAFNLTGIAQQPYHSLSGGEAQRLQLARVLASEPDLLLVDEPTAQLDSKTATEVNETLGRLADRGAAVIIATHDARTAASCDRIIDLMDYQVP